MNDDKNLNVLYEYLYNKFITFLTTQAEFEPDADAKIRLDRLVREATNYFLNDLGAFKDPTSKDV